MQSRALNIVVAALLTFLASAPAGAHGVIQDPKARNQYCGVEIKPHEAAGTLCAEPFASHPNDGYQFMSVLSHADRPNGRAFVDTLPGNVCGFDSETWNGRATPWDVPIDWPTSPMSAGRRVFTWSIFWGPHFYDTMDFRYWITKADFQYQIGKPLSWNDFESKPFCELFYDHRIPFLNPDVTSDLPNGLFHTYCSVPARSGRHVIYGEWGRKNWNYERFHSCVDVSFGGPEGIPPNAFGQSLSVDKNGALAITLSGHDGDGVIDGYSIVTPPANGTLKGMGRFLQYNPNLDFFGPDAFEFIVTDDDGLTSQPARVSISMPENRPPDAQFTVRVSGKEVHVDASSSDDPNGDTLSYFWYFGDNHAFVPNETVFGVTGDHTYKANGNYSITLIVNDGHLVDKRVKSVMIAAPESTEPESAEPSSSGGDHGEETGEETKE